MLACCRWKNGEILFLMSIYSCNLRWSRFENILFPPPCIGSSTSTWSVRSFWDCCWVHVASDCIHVKLAPWLWPMLLLYNLCRKLDFRDFSSRGSSSLTTVKSDSSLYQLGSFTISVSESFQWAENLETSSSALCQSPPKSDSEYHIINTEENEVKIQLLIRNLVAD